MQNVPERYDKKCNKRFEQHGEGFEEGIDCG